MYIWPVASRIPSTRLPFQASWPTRLLSRALLRAATQNVLVENYRHW
jgi:hypothetical protein